MPTRPVAYTATTVRTPPGYSHAMRAGGLLFVSGQVPLDAEGNLVGPGDPAEQARQVFRNLGLVLAAAGATFADVVKLTYFVRDIGAIAAIRAVRDEFVDRANPPASSLVEVSGLFRPDLLIEIEAVAAVD
jgi:reactive intermediate/imine deaminase